MNTKLVDKGTLGATDDANISYKGPFVTLSYRFGGHKDAAPAPVYVTPHRLRRHSRQKRRILIMITTLKAYTSTSMLIRPWHTTRVNLITS